jgi:hypothetical protein
MPIQRPKEFSEFGSPNTVRGAIRTNLVYTQFYDGTGALQKRLLLECPQPDGMKYLEIEGMEKVVKAANPDLEARLKKVLGPPPAEMPHDEPLELKVAPQEAPQ